MKKIMRSICMVLVFTLILGNTALADAVTNEKYLALGNDLSEQQKNQVLEMLGIRLNELDSYNIVKITNQDEYDNLGSYLDKSVIGSKALSSVLITKKEEGNGIKVTTKNISYCTIGMYRNALITAGITDADVIVAAPFSITGTAALVGAMKAYSSLTGTEIPEANMDAATNELVVTGEVADSVGDTQKAEELIAAVKQQVFEDNLATSEDIRGAVQAASESLEINLSEVDQEKIVALMDKINDLDLDVDTIKDQAKELYDKLGELDIDKEGLISSIGGFFANIFESIANFFKNLFS